MYTTAFDHFRVKNRDWELLVEIYERDLAAQQASARLSLSGHLFSKNPKAY